MDKGIKGFALGVVISLIVAVLLLSFGADGIVQFAISSFCILLIAWFTNSRMMKKED